MSTSAVGPYWKIFLSGSVVGVLISSLAICLYRAIFFVELNLSVLVDSLKWGAILALITAAFVITGTIWFARTLNSKRSRIWFVALSVASPLIGWVLLGLLSGLVAGWSYVFFAPLIAVVSATTAGIIAAFAMIFISPDGREDEHLAS